MPIKGMATPRLPRLGKVHLGVKVEPVSGKGSYPRAVDYFVCPDPVREVFGERPKSLRIAFPSDDPEQWCSTYYRCYSSIRGLVCKGDGETAMRLVDMERAVGGGGEVPGSLHPDFWPRAGRDTRVAELKEIGCPPGSCQEYIAKQCRPVMNLQFLLPEVSGLGIWQLDTSSWNSIRNIQSGLRLVEELTGRLSMIPLVLSLTPLEVQPDGVRKTVHVLQLTSDYKLSDLFQYASLPRGQALLPEPDVEVPADLFPQAVIAEAEGDNGGTENQEADGCAPKPADRETVRSPPGRSA